MARRHSYFCLEEANALIPTLEYYFQQLLLLRRDLAELQAALVSSGATLDHKGIALPRLASREVKHWREEYFASCRDYDQLVEEIWDTGVEVVDLDAGVVNFYTWWEGEEVLFSWQYGEPSVQFWCDPGETFTARRSIRQLFLDVPGERVARH